MTTPSSARRWLIQAVFVSTRSPRSISVPTVTISALCIVCPSRTQLFYNPSDGGPRENSYSPRKSRFLRPFQALEGALRTHPEGGRHGRGSGAGPRLGGGQGAPGCAPARRSPREGARRLSE